MWRPVLVKALSPFLIVSPTNPEISSIRRALVLRNDQFLDFILRGIVFSESVSSEAQFANADAMTSGLGQMVYVWVLVRP
jgi:hypothetical protein